MFCIINRCCPDHRNTGHFCFAFLLKLFDNPCIITIRKPYIVVWVQRIRLICDSVRYNFYREKGHHTYMYHDHKCQILYSCLVSVSYHMFFRNGSQVLIHRRFFFTQDHGTYIIQKNIQTQEEPTQKKDTL